MTNESSDIINYQKHWDKVYATTPNEKLGWYEEDLSTTFQLLNEIPSNFDARILIAGSGSTTLVDQLLSSGFKQLIATDISPVGLQNLLHRIGSKKIETIEDDLAHPEKLHLMSPVDLWIDRAVLHFLIEKEDQNTYFKLLKSKLNIGGYALFAQFGLGGASKCCGLPIHQYGNREFEEQLGSDFELVKSFDHTYFNPEGDPRKYIYSLFKRI